MAVFGMGCVLQAADAPSQKAPLTNTERMDFPAGGVLHLKNSLGELTVEGWDQPGMELTTIRSSDKAKITAERHGDEVMVTTDLPHRRWFPPHWAWTNTTGIDVEYRIKVPRDAGLVVDHGVGDVHVEDLSGDIHATVRSGVITLHLPPEGAYAIDAKCRVGNVVSDFAGDEQHKPWPFGHRFTQGGSAPVHKLFLRAGFGDAIILKIQKPELPEQK